ncbi:uncharacterized protein Bfra_009844 [Botrytis fragariae]|uniref:Uncharacterized protein n=1 Tax=Botrytis fragariae TaxID=1964551 RepID=A0A8H6AMV1_9HELO|nr:uncharacterized protein Bfra_009844 [Botrytis fragariae]KAF5870457.1 hypothetical protein Bfra_009844 [Botrytis fragariae]
MSRHYHSSRNEKSHPHSHSRRDTRHEARHEKKKITPKNLAATLGMMGLAIGATLLTEGGPWKSRMAAAATVVGMEQMLESGGFFDGKGDGERRVVKEEEYRRDRGERERRDGRGFEEERRRRDVEDDDERAYRHRRERVREEEDRRETRGTRHGHGHDSHERTRRDTHDEDDRRRRERRARREANRRFDEQYEIEEVPV